MLFKEKRKKVINVEIHLQSTEKYFTKKIQN